MGFKTPGKLVCTLFEWRTCKKTQLKTGSEFELLFIDNNAHGSEYT